MVEIPEGRFVYGSLDQPNSGGGRVVTVTGFWIDSYEVTVEGYQEFLEAKPGHEFCHVLEPVGKSHRPDMKGFGDLANARRPVTGVDWWDAWAYACWAGLRLPTEAEWERASRGDDGRLFPWGQDSPDAQRAVFGGRTDGPLDVGSLGRPSRSPFGLADMSGNVWEWCADGFDAEFAAAGPSQDPYLPAGIGEHVVRGGSWWSSADELRCSRRFHRAAGYRGRDLGFRCVASKRELPPDPSKQNRSDDDG